MMKDTKVEMQMMAEYSFPLIQTSIEGKVIWSFLDIHISFFIFNQLQKYKDLASSFIQIPLKGRLFNGIYENSRFNHF